MFKFEGIDASGARRSGIMWTPSNLAGWVGHLHRSNWRKLSVTFNGVPLAGIASRQDANWPPTPWVHSSLGTVPTVQRGW